MSDKIIKSPQIRFAGFTDAWEQRRFKDFITKAGANNKNGEDYPAYSVSNSLGLIPQTEQFEGSRLDSLDKSAYKFVKPNEFAYNPARINVGSIAFNDTGKTVIVSSLYVIISMSEKLDNEFALQYIKSPEFLNEVRRNTEGSVREYLFYESFKNVKLPYTPNIEEQKKIGELCREIDQTIALHQCKLELLKNTKKSLLQKMFPKDGTNVPEIRFAGFTDAWEQRKLREFTELITKGTTPKDKSGSGTINFVKIENISNGKIDSTTKIYEEEHENYLKRSKLKENDILFSIAGTLGRTAVVDKSILPANTNQALAIIRGYDFDTEFLLTALSGKAVAEFIRKNPTVGAQPNLSLEQVGNLDIPTPEFEEQVKIGLFFSKFDNLITLHQRELDSLKNMKKSLLQQMFI